MSDLIADSRNGPDLPNARADAEIVPADSFSFTGHVDGSQAIRGDSEDWFSYVVPMRGTLSIELTPLDDPLVFSYHLNDDDFPRGNFGGTTEPITASYPVNGGDRFDVQVRSWYSDGGAYQMTVSFDPDPDIAGNEFDAALYFHARLSWNEDVGFDSDSADTFILDAFDSGMHALTLSGMRDNLDVFVYDNTGRLIAAGRETGAADEDVLFPAIGGKRYFIEVKPVGDVVSHYEIMIENTGAPVDHGPVPFDQEDNSFADATELTGSQIITDAVGFDGDAADYYVIHTGEEGLRLTALLGDLAEDIDIVLYRADGFDLRAPYLGGPTDETITYDLEPHETFYLGVLPGGPGDTQSTYTLDVDLEPYSLDENPDFDRATEVLVPTIIEDSVGFAGDDADYFRFEAPASGVMRIALTDLDEDLDLWVFGADTFPVAESLTAGPADEYASVQVLAGETYWVRVNPGLEDEFASTYRLTLDFKGMVDSAGDTLATALPVPLPSRQLESVGFEGDTQDLFRVTVPVSGTVHLTLSGMQENLDLHVFDETGRRIDASKTPGVDDETLSIEGAVGDTFYIGVVPDGAAASPYRLTLGFEDERLVGLELPNDPLFTDQWHLLNIGQRGGTGGIDLNVVQVWTDYTGAGVNVGIYDDGIETDHPDLAANYDANLHLDFLGGKDYPYNVGFSSGHGTAVSGIVAAVANNGIGVTGIAHGASLTGAWVIASPPGHISLTAALGQMDRFDVVNHSWGFIFDFSANADDPTFAAFFANLERTATTGRDGLGTIMVVSAGNGRFAESSSNYSNFSNSPYVIAVAAMDDDGTVASYSSPGANVLVTAPAGNFFQRQGDTITTTDTTGGTGFSSAVSGSDADGTGDYTRGMNGTSAAAPMVTGTVALMLEANPSLHWSEAHTILALSARQTGGSGSFEKYPWIVNGAQTWNGGGLHFSNDYGFGRVDAQAAVRLAETWHAGQAPTTNDDLITFEQSFMPGAGSKVGDETIIPFTQLANMDLSRVTVEIKMSDTGLDNTLIILRSPAGTESILFDGTGTHFFSFFGNDTFTFASNAFRGETAGGTWELVLKSPNGSALAGPSALDSLTVTFYGSTGATPDDRYTFTDEFGTVLAADPSRGFIDDTDGGSNVLNMAAVTSDVFIDLTSRTASIGPHALSWSDRTQFAVIISGDGDDRLSGSGDSDIFFPGRGDDEITTGGGADTITLGPSPGDNTITDFDVDGGDKLDLTPLLTFLDYNGTDPVADGWVSVESDAADTLVLVDRDGEETAYSATTVARLSGQSPESLGPTDDWLIV